MAFLPRTMHDYLSYGIPVVTIIDNVHMLPPDQMFYASPGSCLLVWVTAIRLRLGTRLVNILPV